MSNYIANAVAYFRNNNEKVRHLINNDKTGVPLRPSLSEWNKPEIWQGNHWKWLLQYLKKN